MDIFEAIILGLVQGITEFIPVSSSGHLELARYIFNFSGENYHYLLEFINIGTLLALLIYYRKRIWKILKNIFQERNYKMGINIVITSIPAGLAGLLLGSWIENNDFFGSIFTVAAAMAIVGLIMIIIDWLPHMSKLENEEHLTPARALIIGILQTFALIPGTSRSGTTIIAGRITGLSSESAADYSFLASIPIMCAVCLKTFLSEESRVWFGANLWPMLLGNVIAFVVGLLALAFVLKYLKKPNSLRTFGIYRVAVGCIIIGIMLILV